MLQRADHQARGQRIVVCGTRLQVDVCRFYLAIGIHWGDRIFPSKAGLCGSTKMQAQPKNIKAGDHSAAN
jgi:hypothetical protein